MTNENNAVSGFAALGITGKLLDATVEAGFVDPKPIQIEAIPVQLKGRDIVGLAQTGSGKTAAFALPILSQIVGLGTKRLPKTARALILAPTRELAVQIEDTIKLLAKGLHISTALILGGVSRNMQIKRMVQGVDVLVATPGRLTDLVKEGAVRLSETRFLVLDEADRMLDMGFINDVRRIARATHPERRTALFSATMPAEIEALTESLLKNPVRLSVSPEGMTAPEITQSVYMASIRQKRDLLAKLLGNPDYRSVMVFSRTKHGADKVVRNLVADGFDAAVIHGNKSQNARQKALTGFRDGSVRILVATDIAARGIDVPGVSLVVNYDLPDEAESYVHRIGRTGRNGLSGVAITLCDPAESAKLRAVEKITRSRIAVAGDLRGEPMGDAAPASNAPQRPRHQHSGRPAGEGRGGKPASFGKPRPAGSGQRAPNAAPADGEARRPARRRRRFSGTSKAA